MTLPILLCSVFLPGADIVVAPDAVDSTRFAARELADHLQLVTGVKNAIVTKRSPGKSAVYVGYSPDVAAAGFTTNTLKRQEFTIAFRKDAVYLFGHDAGANRNLGVYPWMFHFEEHASLYAVYDFLRDWCGVEWFDPTDEGTEIRRNPKLAVEGKDVTRSPFTRCRDAGPLSGVIEPELWLSKTAGWTNFMKQAYASCWQGAKNDTEAIRRIGYRKQLFNLRMKGGGEFMHANHSFYSWYERFLHKEHPNFVAYHPDWFAQGYHNKKGARGEITADWDGTKEPPQLCYSNPEVVAQAVRDARDYFDHGGSRKRMRNIGWLGWNWGENCFCLEPMDNSAFCKCPRCTAQYDDALEDQRAKYSRYWFTFVNKVAAELAKSHPDKFISTLAYGDRDGMPKDVKVLPNVIVHFCFSFNRTPYSRAGFKRQVRQFKEWHAAYPDRDIGLWLYNTFPKERTLLYGGFHCFPGYCANVLQREYQLFKELNVRACIFNCGFVDDFENYLSYRWMWNPDEPLATLKDGFFARYGAAGEPLRKFYELVERTYCDASHYATNDVHQNEIIAWGRLGVERVMDELKTHADAALNAPGLTAHQRALVANWKAGVWDYMTTGNVKRYDVPMPQGIACQKTKWLGRHPDAFEGNRIAAPRFKEPFYNERREGTKTHWRDWDGSSFTHFRVTLDRSDALRACCRFRLVGEKDGKVIPLTPFTGESEWQGWHKATDEMISFTTFDFTFEKGVGAGCTKIGIEDDSPSKNWNWPRYWSLEAGGKDRFAKMRDDTLGMFIHWGLYAIPGKGEWHLWRDNVPLAEYDTLAGQFAPPTSFSPRQWVKLAKRMGARYAVLTTRHHDGFCLFDTKTTPFNSVQSAAKRDFVREFAEACREEGIRVGFYFSIMNWQYYPRRSADFDAALWRRQVDTTHEALRELMTNYGKVDYLWYDGCRAPGGNDADYMERMWRIRDLNAMARSLQPDILINDRSMVPEDFATPEQSLAAPLSGRAWESCITVNGTWGYRPDDVNWKSSETLFRSLLHCVRHGGNLLVNIGPRADGSVPEACVKALEGLGAKIRECPESIYGATRDAQTEATREGGVVTHANGSYWFWALETNRLDGVARQERRGPRASRITFNAGARPCRCLGKRHDLDLKAGDAPVLGDTAELEAPPEGTVEPLTLPEATALDVSLPAGGAWQIDVGYVNAGGFKDTLTATVRVSRATGRVNVPIPGKGIYARRISPLWQPLSPKTWQIAGVFETLAVAANFAGDSVRAVFAGDLLTQAKNATFGAVPTDNDRADKADVRLSYVYSAARKGQGMAFARRTVRAETERSLYAALGCDWWGAVYVNGREALPFGDGWKPRAFQLDLNKGDNEILVACHSGSGQHWFTFFTNEPLVPREQGNLFRLESGDLVDVVPARTVNYGMGTYTWERVRRPQLLRQVDAAFGWASTADTEVGPPTGGMRSVASADDTGGTRSVASADDTGGTRSVASADDTGGTRSVASAGGSRPFSCSFPPGTNQVPAMLFLSSPPALRDQALKRGYAAASLDVSGLTPASAAKTAIAAFDRLRREERVDCAHIGVFGFGPVCGRAAFLAGAHETRFALAAAVDAEVSEELLALQAPHLAAIGASGEDVPRARRAFDAAVAATPAWFDYGLSGLDITIFPGEDDLNYGGTLEFFRRPGASQPAICDVNRVLDFCDWRHWRHAPGTPPTLAGLPPLNLTTKENWEKTQRPAVIDFYTREIFGRFPVGKPDALTFAPTGPDVPVFGGKGVRREVTISFRAKYGDAAFKAVAYIPKRAKPVPAFIAITCMEDPRKRGKTFDDDSLEMALSRGYAMVGFWGDDYMPDLPLDPATRVNWQGRFLFGKYEKPAERTRESWGAIGVWAWTASRVLDWLETQPDIDAKHVAVAGNSRAGKTAIWAAVNDTRFAMACPNCSGCLGARLSHIDCDGIERMGPLMRLQTFWFADNIWKWSDTDRFAFPYDQHQLAACIAPRLLAVGTGSDDIGAGPEGERLMTRAASPVWTQLYGVTNAVHFHSRPGGHYLGYGNWKRYMDFADAHGWTSFAPESKVSAPTVALSLPFESTVVVTGRDVSSAFALKELNVIVKAATGRAFGEGTKGEGANAKRHRIFLGRSPEAEAILGTAFFDALKDEESVVLAKGDNLFLVGGGQLGALYAVYDFVEDNLGFRHYFRRDDGFVVDKVKEVTFSGKSTRKRPAFHGYRSASSHWLESEWLYHIRNRSNTTATHLIPAFDFAWRQNISGHGLFYFIPPKDPDPRYGWRPKEVRGEFERHPEWFSLGEDGQRHSDMQLCFSNPGCRARVTETMLAYVREKGRGIYMLGSNDGHNTRYCWCEGCIALEKMYNSVGGPLWDYILELCAELKARKLDGVYIHSLAYKGPTQTERAPAGIGRFPDNFICDAAFLNSDRELKKVPDERLEDGTVFNRLANLKRWREMCAHLSYWYYGGANPAQVYVRMQQEVREIYAAGVEAIFACGTGGGYEFGDFTAWIMYRLMRDPYADLEPDLKRIFAAKYGPAAGKVREYADMLQAIQRRATAKLRITTGCDDPYAGFSFLEGKDLIALRRIADGAASLAKGTPYEQAVRESRLGLDIFTLTYFHKIRNVDAAAAARIDCKVVLEEARGTIAAMKHIDAYARGYLLGHVNAMANYSNLKDDALPPELANYPTEKVYRILPPARAPHICGGVVPNVYTCEADPKAVSGWAWTDPIPEKRDISQGIGVDVYSDSLRKWLWTPNKNPIPLANYRKGEYTLWRLCETELPNRVCLVFAGNWGGPTSTAALSRLFDPSYQNRQWEIWISSRGEGPKFFADEDAAKPSRIWIDQIFCVDKGVPDGK